MNDPSGGRSFVRGDGFSDINTVSAVKYFQDFGFWKSKLRPMHQYEGNEQTALVYSRYPAFPDVIVGVWARIINSTKEVHLRLLPFIFSIGFFFFIYYFLMKWLPNRMHAFLGASILVLSNYFVAWADTLHKHTFEEIFKWIFVFVLLKYFQSKSSVLIFLTFLLAILIANTSLEPIVFLSVCTFVMNLFFEKSGIRKVLNPLNFTVAAGFIIGFGLHFYLNSLYYGSVEKAAADFTLAFLHRTNQCNDPTLCDMTFKNYLELPLIFVNRIERFFLIPGFALIYLFYLCRKEWLQSSPRTLQIAYALLISSFSWFVVMSQHAKTHTFTGKQMGIFFAWIVGTGLYLYWQKLRLAFYEKDRARLFFHSLFILYILSMALTQHVVELYWKHGFSRFWSAM